MPSASLIYWDSVRRLALDEIENTHRSIGGSGRVRRTATQQLNHSYTMILSSHFQGFCRELHDECVVCLVKGIGPNPLRNALQNALTQNRKLDRGNPNPGNIGADFGLFGLSIWQEARHLDLRNRARQTLIEELNDWRNAVAHQDFTKFAGATTLHLRRVQAWRAACHQLAAAFDEVMRRHFQAATGVTPW